MNIKETEQSEGFTSESWEMARAYAQSLGNLPSSFTALVRLIIADFEKDPGSIAPYCAYGLSRIYKSATFKARLYHAIVQLRPEMLPPSNVPITGSTFLKSFDGFEHAILLAMVLMTMAVKKKAEQEMLQKVLAKLCRNFNLGWYIGKAIPAISPAVGAVGGAFRVLGLLPILLHDPKGFKEYWSKIYNPKQQIDIQFEYMRWRCNSLQIACLLCQQLGLGINRAIPLMRAMLSKSPVLHQDAEEQQYRSTEIWLNAFIGGRETPEIPLPPRFYPNRDKLVDLQQKAAEISNWDGSWWLTQDKRSISPQTTPQLYMAPEEEDFPVSPDSEDFPTEGLSAPERLEMPFEED